MDQGSSIKIAAVCPGQGVKLLGQGQELLADFALARELFSLASDTLGHDFAKLIQEGPEETLRRSAILQPAILLFSVTAWRVLHQETGLKPTMAAGHSLGEYSALVIAGALDLQDALRAVNKRGELMESALPAGQGAMAAVLGLSPDLINQACEEAAQGEVVCPVNFNAPGQVVISGHTAAVQRASEAARAKGAKRVISLKVGGAFHTSLMAPAAAGMESVLNSLKFSTPCCPVVSNVDARPYPGAEAIAPGLVRQITRPVLWEDSIRYISGQDVNVFIEPGPDKVLGDMIKRISEGARTWPMRSPADLAAITREMAHA